MHFAREPLDRIVFAPDGPGEVVIRRSRPRTRLARCAKPFLATISSPARLTSASIFDLIDAQGTARGALRLLRPAQAPKPPQASDRRWRIGGQRGERLLERGQQRLPRFARTAPPHPRVRCASARFGRRPWRSALAAARAAAPMRPTRSSPVGDAQDVALLREHRPHQAGGIAFAGVALSIEPRRRQWHGDDAHLIRHQAEDVGKLGATSRRNRLQSQIAGKRIELRERPAMARAARPATPAGPEPAGSIAAGRRR